MAKTPIFFPWDVGTSSTFLIYKGGVGKKHAVGIVRFNKQSLIGKMIMHCIA